MTTTSWKDIKDKVYGKKGTPRRDELERELAYSLNKIPYICCHEKDRICFHFYIAIGHCGKQYSQRTMRHVQRQRRAKR
jgi:hypothetical protein